MLQEGREQEQAKETSGYKVKVTLISKHIFALLFFFSPSVLFTEIYLVFQSALFHRFPLNGIPLRFAVTGNLRKRGMCL